MTGIQLSWTPPDVLHDVEPCPSPHCLQGPCVAGQVMDRLDTLASNATITRACHDAIPDLHAIGVNQRHRCN